MINLLVKKFIPNSEDTSNIVVRQKYGMLCGILGIILNIALFLLKIIAGFLSGSIAIVTDAFNNLSDMGSSVVMMIGAKLSGKTADREHPYGHGRAEYISALVISFLIIYCGAELLKSSVVKVFNYEAVPFNIVPVILMLVTFPVKFWMWHYNRGIGMKINSSVLLAAAKDSLNDTIATGTVVVTTIISPFISFPVDALMGVVLSVLIIKTGVDVARETTDRLIGEAPDEELSELIESYVVDGEKILGMHGLMIHDYGPGCKFASVHVEVPHNMSLVEVHDMIDEIEYKILEEISVDIVIHTDPVRSSNEAE